MKNSRLRNLLLAMLTVSVIAISSCGDEDDDAVAAPEASFTNTVDGKTVTFTNTSSGEEATYEWDFGDGNTSTEAAPTHTYEANGSYVVKLTATNEAGSDDTQAVLEISNITIDGDLSDWDDVEALPFDGEGSIKEVKMENLGNQKLYFYILGSSETTSFLDLYLNLDYEAAVAGGDTTGLNTNAYPMSNLGWDVLFEGFFGHQAAREEHGIFYGIFYHPTDEDGIFSNNIDFATRQEPGFDNQITFTDVVAVGSDIAYEFSIDLTAMPASLVPEAGDRIQFFIDEWVNSPETTDGWWASFISHYPAGQTVEDAEAATYTLK